MEFSYFDNCVHRWCKAYDEEIPFMDTDTLTNAVCCEKFNKAKKGKISKAKCLKKEDYLRRHPE